MGQNNFDKNNLQDLIEIFREAGAIDPESWASSQLEEGINQLGRFSFLKAITSEWVKQDDLSWVDNQIKFDYSVPGKASSQFPIALKEMLDKNVKREFIIDLVREIQFSTLYHVCSIIDRSAKTNFPVNNWGLFEMDDDDNPMKNISGLHESLLEFDPSGNEMRPRSADNSR